MLYYAKQQLAPYLCKLWNYIYIIHGKAPFEWKFSDIYPIPKPGRDNSITKNNRPISLLPIMARVFEKALSNRVITWCIKHNIIKPWNCAFQPNKSTEDIMADIAETVIRNFQGGSMTEVEFMDLQSAYDTVWREGLLYKCIGYGMDGNFICFMKSYFSDRYNRVTYSEYSTEWKKSEVGLPQGGPLMPILWTLFINDFEFEIGNEFKIELRLAAFADDLTIYTMPCPYDYEVIKLIQLGVNQLFDFTRFNRLVMGPVKCKSISLSRALKYKAHVYEMDNIPMECIHSPSNAPDICCHSKIQQHKELAKQLKLKTDSNYPNPTTTESFNKPSQCKLSAGDPHSIPLWARILGLYYDPKLKWNQHVNQIVNRVKQKLYQLQRITYSPRFRLNTKTVWKLYQSTIRPIMEYGLSIYGTTNQFQKLEQLQNRALRIAFRAKNGTNQQYLNLLMNVQTMEERRDRIRIKYWAKLIRSHPTTLPCDTFDRWHQYATTKNLIKTPHYKRSDPTRPTARFKFDKVPKIAESPIAQAYNTIDKIVPTGEEIPYSFEPQFYRSPPCYEIPFPTNMEIYQSLDDYNVVFSENNNNILEAWTDGSCKPNPGPGGASVYFPQIDTISQNHSFDHEVTINFAEIVAIRMAFESIINNIQMLNNYSNISIFTDSQFCLNLFTNNSYPSLRIYYDVLMEIYQNIIQLQNNYNFNIKFIKVESHTDIE